MYVYVMYDKNNEVLYVGKTRDMRYRMTQHFGKNKEMWKNDVVNVKYINCITEVDMSIYEIYLINTLKPKHNASLLYKGESNLLLNYNLMDYNLDIFSDDLSRIDKDKIKKYMILYEDKGKSKFNSNYDANNIIKSDSSLVSNRWSIKNQDKYSKIIKNAISYYTRIRKNNTGIRKRNMYISIWGNCIDINNEYVKKFQKYINQTTSDENTKIICYLRNDYIPKDKDKSICEKKSVLNLINIINNSAISKDEYVHVYIPSKRMRELLDRCLNNEL